MADLHIIAGQFTEYTGFGCRQNEKSKLVGTFQNQITHWYSHEVIGSFARWIPGYAVSDEMKNLLLLAGRP